MYEPKFKVGDRVQFGYGIIAHEVVAVITTGRIPTYDVICRDGMRRGARRQGVLEGYLNYHYPRKRNYG